MSLFADLNSTTANMLWATSAIHLWSLWLYIRQYGNNDVQNTAFMHWIWITIIYSNFRILLRVLHLLWARPRSPIWFAETARGLVTQTKTVHTKIGPSQARSRTVKRSTGTATTAYSKFGICLLSGSKCNTQVNWNTRLFTWWKYWAELSTRLN